MARDGFTCSEIYAFADALKDADKETSKKVKKLLRDHGTKLRRKTAQKARAKVRKQAVHRKGVERATILDGRVKHSILIELLSDVGAGTMFQ